MTKEEIKLEVLLASKNWINCFNKADIQKCSQTYLDNAVMNARPMGRFEGRDEIYAFWNNFIKITLATDLKYSNIYVELINENLAKLSAQWSMNIGYGFITEELWIKEHSQWFLLSDDFTVEKQF